MKRRLLRRLFDLSVDFLVWLWFGDRAFKHRQTDRIPTPPYVPMPNPFPKPPGIRMPPAHPKNCSVQSPGRVRSVCKRPVYADPSIKVPQLWSNADRTTNRPDEELTEGQKWTR